MSQVVTVDVVVDLKKFINVDLISQGLYYVAVTINDLNGNAKPYDITCDSAMKRGTNEWETMMDARLDNEKKSANSRHFYVRYVEQVVSLFETCKFTITSDIDTVMSISKDGVFADQIEITFELFHVSKDRLETMSGDAYSRQRGTEGRFQAYSTSTSKKIVKALKDGKPGVRLQQKDGTDCFIDLKNMTEVLEDGYARRIVKTQQAITDDLFKRVAKVIIPFKASLLPHTEWIPVTFSNWYFARMEATIKSSITAIYPSPLSKSLKPSTPRSPLKEVIDNTHVSYLLYAIEFIKLWTARQSATYNDMRDLNDVSIKVDMRASGTDELEKNKDVSQEVQKKDKLTPRMVFPTACERVCDLIENGDLLQLCHFIGNPRDLLQDAKEAAKAVKTLLSNPSLVLLDGEPPSEALGRLSLMLSAAWVDLCAGDPASRKFNEECARTAFFSHTSAYYKSLLNQASPSALPPNAPQYYDYPQFTEIAINEVRTEADDPREISPRENDISEELSPSSIDLGMHPGAHIIVFVHGWKGHSGDFHLLKNFLELYLQEGTHYLICQSMQGHPNASIKQLGEHVAMEVDEFISQIGMVDKLTFVGHSMGTLVTRSCLRSKYMQKYLDCLYSFFSFSGPHLGVAISESKTIGCAIGFLSTFKRSKNIRELRLDDSYLHTLSTCSKIGKFKHVLLFGSEEDGFVGFDSALAFPTTQPKLSAGTSKKKKRMVSDIARNLTANSIQNTTLRRFLVRFNPQGRKQLTNWVDRFIGKDVHISFIINIDFMHAVINNFKQYF